MTVVPRQPRAGAPFSDVLQRDGEVVLDGALATELEQRGCDLNDALWSARVLMEQPGSAFRRRLAGHLETGKPSRSDPALGRA